MGQQSKEIRGKAQPGLPVHSIQTFRLTFVPRTNLLYLSSTMPGIFRSTSPPVLRFLLLSWLLYLDLENRGYRRTAEGMEQRLVGTLDVLMS